MQKDSEEWGRKLEISTVGELNDQIVSQGMQKILLMQEAIQESGIARIAEQIVKAGNKKFVMIGGHFLLRQDYLFSQAVHSAGGARNEATSHCC